mmetsp:Transcript_35537/g.99844  ORF Transcript_35537/g.99844 Transcript_35537/m.99844 type:complete len:373 (-) Transcript_35537:148-1266(-)
MDAVQRQAEQEPDALDQKGNRYFRRKLVRREFLMRDLMKLTFELPEGVSLKSLGVDAGLGDFLRMRPHAEEHKQLVENPAGGRAYSPVSPPEAQGEFGLIVKAYGPDDRAVGVSSLLRRVPIGTEMLVTSHTEHVFWKERNRGYYCNDRSITPGSEGQYHLGLIAFGIGITEVAPVAMSELLDPRVQKVTILWANKYWSDADWVWRGVGTADDLVHKFFAEQGRHGARLEVKHILSREERPEACFHGRITADVLRRAFLDGDIPRSNLKFLAVGTAAMIDSAYEQLGELGLDVVKEEHWTGRNLLYQKCSGASACADRALSPLLAATGGMGGGREQQALPHGSPGRSHMIVRAAITVVIAWLLHLLLRARAR